MIKEELNIAPNDISLLSNSQVLLRDLTSPGKGNMHMEQVLNQNMCSALFSV